ncbi:MAG: hypothetical protein KDB32_10695, partial [Planctomycetes bacterium]|nr:hypothetical protein [Planctomycetota bacterium]
ARLLVAMYMAGTHDFYWFEDGKFTPCWERNGTEEYDDQIESIYARWHGDRLFLNLLRRDGKGELWTLRDDKLVALTDPAKLGVLDWFDGGNAAVGRDGLCFVATAKDTRKLYVSDGLETKQVKAADGRDLSLDDDCELAGVGGGVIATSEGFDQFRSWIITGGTANLLGTHKRGSVAVYRCVAADKNADLIRQCNEQGETSWKVWRDGKSADADIEDWPENAGNVFSAWTLTEDGKSVAYFIERPTAQGSKFRLWSLTR